MTGTVRAPWGREDDVGAGEDVAEREFRGDSLWEHEKLRGLNRGTRRAARAVVRENEGECGTVRVLGADQIVLAEEVTDGARRVGQIRRVAAGEDLG